eukprot:TRINITY_DN2567_c0_g1_i1.p1 TRINITY_DN2567_c0_g1~~TRINITY_DN2567_c0_g1_i1.p1  ORF type:complete len:193 (+),score=35.64 TRINITY_DN2567_c0_g1_i1:172-750(+)
MRKAWRKLSLAALDKAMTTELIIGEEGEGLLNVNDHDNNIDRRVELVDNIQKSADGMRVVRSSAQLLARVALFKLGIATILVTVAAVIVERDGITAVRTASLEALALISGGALLTALYQITRAAMPRYTSGASIGLIAQLKVIPQLTIAHFLYANQHGAYDSISFSAVLGASLVVVASIAYAVERYFAMKSK